MGSPMGVWMVQPSGIRKFAREAREKGLLDWAQRYHSGPDFGFRQAVGGALLWEFFTGSEGASLAKKKKKSTFSLPTLTKVRFFSLYFKTRQTTSLDFSNHAFYLPETVSKAVATVNNGFIFLFF